MKELDYLITLSAGGVQSHIDGAAQNNNITEWFDTPQGSIADYPAWGHNLGAFRFEPDNSEDVAVMLEMSIVEKLTQDVVGVQIYSIRIEVVEFDRWKIVLHHNYGTYRNDNYRLAA